MSGTLKMLMWKHFTVRKRRFIYTAVELASPLMYFIFLFVLKDLLVPKPSSYAIKQLNNVHHTETMPLDSTRVPDTILYTPDTELAGVIMDAVGQKLNLNRLHSFPDAQSKGFYAFTNDSTIVEFVKKMDDKQAIIIFENIDEEKTKKLNYTIRMNIDYMTHLYKSLDDNSGPHERFGTIYGRFMRLQWAIDSSYLEIISGKKINQTVELQEFPYAETRQNPYIESICTLLAPLCWAGLLLLFVFLMTRLLEERTTGVQELIKIVGVSSNMLGVSHFLNVLPGGLVYSVAGTVLLTVSASPLIPLSNPALIFLMLTLHYLTVVVMAFVCSYFTKSTQYAVSLSMMAYVVSWMPVRMLDGVRMHRMLLVLTGFLPHAPMYWFWKELAALEQYGSPVSFTTMWSSHSAYSESVFLAFVMLVAQGVILAAAAWYLARVCPGQYGTALPWDFIFQKQYWCEQKVSPDEPSHAEEEPIACDQRYFEAPPNLEVGIRIANVSKVFGKQRALCNVSLDVYKGEITVLLGHNGAGKTTLMSIITGMIRASEGKVFVNGLDTVSQQTAVRRQLGLCPQHNLFFPDLTIMEHVMFFSLLKGVTFAQATESSLELLTQLGIANKASNRSGELSGGMKRRLQLACALAGGANVLILDEPTSGLDVETRRELWDLLLSLRGSRTVLLTTHFMEEADALGDRVAALHGGRLRCHAAPMYLKKSIGTGYRLSLTTIGQPNEAGITAAVTSQVPDATLKEQSLNSISYNLPAQCNQRFPQLFTKLEERRSELGIDSIGVGVSTLEEVFLRLCSDVDTSFTEDTVDGTTEEVTYNRLSGFPLNIRQMIVLMKRQCKYLLAKKLSFFLLQVVFPIAMIFSFTYTFTVTELADVSHNQLTSLDLDLYKDMPERRAYVDAGYLATVSARYKKVDFEVVPDVASAVLRSGHDLTEYNKYLVGVELNDTNAKVLYTTTVRHAAPVALNLLSNMLAARLVPGAGGRSITSNNHPLEDAYVPQQAANIEHPKSFIMGAIWAVSIGFIIMATTINAVTLPCKERVSGTRHLHVLAGCPPSVLWLSALLWHGALYCSVLLLPALLAAALCDRQGTLAHPAALGCLFVVMLVGCCALLALVYLVSFALEERGAEIMLVVFVVAFGLISGPVQAGYGIYDEKMQGVWSLVTTLASYTMPPHAMVEAMIKATNVARINAYCSLNAHLCPDIPVYGDYMGFDLDKCCVLKENPRCYFCVDRYSPMKEIIVLAIQLVVYMVLVVLAEHGLFNWAVDKASNMRYVPPPPRFHDEMVRAERTYVSKGITLPNKQVPDAMLVDDVHKNYFGLKKSCNAVRGISFSVKKGECFGLLGVNGAGKSSTFKVLTGQQRATRGAVLADAQRLQFPRGKYLHSLGYCPQFFGLDEFLTGKENLTLMLTLRGLEADVVEKEVKAWIAVVGLEKYTNKAVSCYSGGCSRRLATAAALCMGASVTLLDEPTSGVDVSARRRVWAALRRALRQHRSVIITSHSMDEMEALCHRIGIMCGGELGALGAPAALRARHAAGHAVVLKIHQHGAAPTDVTDSTMALDHGLQSLKEQLHEKFNCTLKDEHKTMLHYHINETMRYSELFAQLEALKEAFPFIEDYSVTETTLEEVFLSFAEHRYTHRTPSGPSAV